MEELVAQEKNEFKVLIANDEPIQLTILEEIFKT